MATSEDVVSLEEFTAGAEEAPPPTAVKPKGKMPAKPSDVVSWEEMKAEEGPEEQKGSWLEMLSDVPEQIQDIAASQVAAGKALFWRGGKRLSQISTKNKPSDFELVDEMIAKEEGVMREVQARSPEHQTPNLDWKQKGVQYALVSLPNTVMGYATGGPAGAISAITGGTTLEAYGRYTGQGAPHGMALEHSMFEGGVEGVTEAFPAFAIFKKNPLFKKLVTMLAVDVPGEMVAQYMQGASAEVEKARMAGEPITNEVLWKALAGQTKEMPSTIVAAIVGSGIPAAGMYGVNRLTGTVLEESSKPKPNNQKAEAAFAELNATNPKKAAEVVAEVAKTSPEQAKLLASWQKKYVQPSEKDLKATGAAAAKAKTEEAKAQVAAAQKRVDAGIASMTPNVADVFNQQKKYPLKDKDGRFYRIVPSGGVADNARSVINPVTGERREYATTKDDSGGDGGGGTTIQSKPKAPADVVEAVKNSAPEETLADLVARAQKNVSEEKKSSETEEKPTEPEADNLGRTEESLKSKPGVNAQRMANILSLQHGDPSTMVEVSIKEILQNSADAIRTMLQGKSIEKGNIDIQMDKDARTITFKDNGSGMAPEILGTKFLEIAGTGKEAANNAGGFGIAKMLFLYSNKEIHVITMRNGKVSEMKTTGEELKQALADPEAAPTIEVRAPTEIDKQTFPDGHGTVIKVKVPDSYKDPSTGLEKEIAFDEVNSYSRPFPLKYSALLAPIEVNLNGQPVNNVGTRFDAERYQQFVSVKFDWGTARIYVGDSKYSPYKNLHVLSNGLWQFSGKLNKDPTNPYGESLPYEFYVDVVPSVKPDEPGYPFTFNRLGFTEVAKADFAKIINYINSMYAYQSLTDDAKSFGSMRYLEGNKLGEAQEVKPTVPPASTAFTRIQKGDKAEVVDGKLLINGKEAPELTAEEMKSSVPMASELMIDQSTIDPNRVMVHENLEFKDSNDNWQSVHDYMMGKFGARYEGYLGVVGRAFKDLRDQVAKTMGYSALRKEAVGVSLDQYRGVSIIVPFQGMFVNPLMARGDNTIERAYGMLGTMLHELAHHKERNHGANFPAEMQMILLKMQGGSHKLMGFDFHRFQEKFVASLQNYTDIIDESAKVLSNDNNLRSRGNTFKDGEQESVAPVSNEGVDGSQPGAGRADRTGESVLEGSAGGRGLAGSGNAAGQARADAEATRAVEITSEGLAESMGELHEAINKPEAPESPAPTTADVLVKGNNPLYRAYRELDWALRETYLNIRDNIIAAPKKTLRSSSIVQELINKSRPGPLQDTLMNLIKRREIQIEFYEGESYTDSQGKKHTGGAYVPVAQGGPRIVMPMKLEFMQGGNFTEMLVHELHHAYTYEFMVENPNHPAVIQAKKLLADARTLIPEVLDSMNAAGTVVGWTSDMRAQLGNARGDIYGLSDVYEFIAETKSNPHFQRLLAVAGKFDKKGILAKFQKVLNTIATKIATMLNYSQKEASLLVQSMDVTARIMEAADQAHAAGTMRNSTQRVITSPDGQIRKAFDSITDKARVIPGVTVVEGKLSEYWDQVLRTFAPEARGPQALQAGAILAKATATEAQKTSMIHGQSVIRKAFWDSRIGEAEGFLSAYERGETFTDPLLQKAADAYRAWSAAIFAADTSKGIEYEARDNYIYHLFEDSKGVQKFFERTTGMKWGDPKFTKDRVFQFYDQAKKAGFKPLYTNPEDIMLARQHASDIAHGRIDALNELEKYGLARKVKKGETVGPMEGGKLVEGYHSMPRRSPNGERFWINDQAQAVMHNLYDTPSLWAMKGMGGDAFRGLMYLKNAIVPIKLGLSLFHPLHVATIDNATGMVRASKELAAGTIGPLKWMAEMGRASLYRDALRHPKAGYRILKLVQGKLPESEITDADRVALMVMAEGGFIPEMSPQYKTGARHSFMESVRQGRLVKAAGQLPFAAIDAMQAPMFEIWIPSLKIASYLRDAATALKTDPTLVSDPLKRAQAFRKLSKSVDNRYGEMAYNTLFWNRLVKDAGVASTLSLGWNLGFVREYGGAVIETVRAPTTEGGVAAKMARGELDKALFVTYYTVQSMIYGGLMTYLLSGDQPEEWLDYIYPKNGEKNPDGSDQRVSTMFYAREFAAIYKHMETEGVLSGLGTLALNKASPAIGMVRDFFSGVNYFGEEIRNPRSPAYQQVIQTLSHTFKELEPMSTMAMRQGATAVDVKKAVMSVAGFTPAPKYATESKIQGHIKSLYQKYHGTPRKSFEKAEISDEATELKNIRASGDRNAYHTKLLEIKAKYGLSGAETKQLNERMTKGGDPFLRMFTRLEWQQQKELLDEMTPEERLIYQPHSNKAHLRRKYQPPEEN